MKITSKRTTSAKRSMRRAAWSEGAAERPRDGAERVRRHDDRPPRSARPSAPSSRGRLRSRPERPFLIGALCTVLLAQVALIGCADSYSVGTASQNPQYETARAVDPNFQLGNFFDGSGRLRDPLLAGPGADEVWVISKSPGAGEHSLVGPLGQPIKNQQGFSPHGLTQDSLNLVDLLGGIDEDTFAGAVLVDQQIDPRHYIAPCGGIVGIAPPAVPGGEATLIPVPLEHTDVQADIAAYIATVEVTQQFHNPYNGKIEAVYVFPLPDDAAVNEFIMTIGDRKIRGIIREREEAEQIYNEARAQGYRAALLHQQRPNIFMQKVANIEPQKRIDVTIKYFHTLDYDDGWYEWAFPMVVGPRFNPPGSVDPINPVDRTNTTLPTHGTNVPYLPPSERSGHDIALEVEIDAGVEIEEIACASHVIEKHAEHSARSVVRLSPRDSIPNKDFVLRYRVAGDRIKTAMLTHRDPSRFGDLGHFTLMIYPPDDLEQIERQPLEMIFVLDCSGSMSGEPLAIAKRAAERALKQMREGDSFQIIRFSNNASALGPKPLEATADNIQRGVRYLRSLQADGGTMMIEGIKAALDFPKDRLERQRYIVFLTDGYIGNEAEILREMRSRLESESARLEAGRPRASTRTRIFSFGIGSSPNRFLLERMASLGEGVVAYVGLNDSPVEVMDRFVQRIAHPAMEKISIDFGPTMRISDTFPREDHLPDLFAGRPIILAGRYQGEGVAQVTIEGVAGKRELSIPVTVDLDASEGRHDGIASVWARTQIMSLANAGMVNPDDVEIPDRIRSLALEYALMSAYTSFVAVDSSERTAGEFGTTVPVGVPVPDGVRYDTTVGRER